MGIQERKVREKERRRQQILVAAKRVFSDKGFNRTTIEDIANEAELSSGTLYLYFKNKEELFASLSLRILQYMIIRLEEVKSDMQVAPQKKLDALNLAMIDVYDFDPAAIINMFHLQSSETLRNLSPGVLSEFYDLCEKSMNIFTQIFKKGVAEGAFIDVAPESIADGYWSLFSGIVLWEAGKEIMAVQKNNLKAALEFGFKLFKRGILAHPDA